MITTEIQKMLWQTQSLVNSTNLYSFFVNIFMKSEIIEQLAWIELFQIMFSVFVFKVANDILIFLWKTFNQWFWLIHQLSQIR